MCREHFDFVLPSLQLDRRRRSFVGSPVTTDLIKFVSAWCFRCYILLCMIWWIKASLNIVQSVSLRPISKRHRILKFNPESTKDFRSPPKSKHIFPVTMCHAQPLHKILSRSVHKFLSDTGESRRGRGIRPCPFQSYAVSYMANYSLKQHVNVIKILKNTKYLSGNSACDCQVTFSFKELLTLWPRGSALGPLL